MCVCVCGSFASLTAEKSFNRENLHYEVRKKSKKKALEEVVQWLREKFPDNFPELPSGIIYCLARRECEEVLPLI